MQELAWWAVTRRTLKNHKTVKSGGWALARDNTVYTTVSGSYTIFQLHIQCMLKLFLIQSSIEQMQGTQLVLH